MSLPKGVTTKIGEFRKGPVQKIGCLENEPFEAENCENKSLRNMLTSKLREIRLNEF